MRSRQTIQNLALVLAAAAFLTLGIAQSQAHAPRDASISPAVLPVAIVGQSYSAVLSVTGSKPNDEVRVTSGTLPAGLALSTAGVFSGRPTTAGSTSFTVALVGASGDLRASLDYTLTVQAAAAATTTTTTSNSQTSSGSTSSATVTISPSALVSGKVGVAYSQTISVSGPTPPYTVKVTQGALPGGLSLSSGGSLSGTPTASGSFAFTVSAFTAGGSYAGFRDYTLSITSVPVTISPSTLVSGKVGVAYSQTVSVSGPTPPYTVKVTQGALPGGLSLSSGGSLSGTPTTSGSFAFTVSALTAGGSYAGFRDYTLSIAAATVATSTATTTTISPSSLPSATVAVTYSQTLSVSGSKGPYTVRVTQGSLPAGLSLSSSGTLSGKPTTAGSYAFTVSAYTSTGSYATFRDYKLSVLSGTSGTTTTTGGTLWFGDDFENGIRSPWTESASSSQYSLVSGWSGQAVQLIATTLSGGSSGSQMTALWFGGNSPLAHAYQGQDSWYHLRLNFPSTYYPTTGNWNWVTEWHIDPTTQSSCSGAVSIALGVYTDYPVLTNAFGKNPRLALRLAGGSCSSPSIQTIQLPSNSLLKNHWYDLYFHFVWSTSSTTGLAEWIVDGSQKASLHFPTLYNRGGTPSTSNFGFYNYRLAANFIAPIQYDHVRIGSTKSAVQ